MFKPLIMETTPLLICDSYTLQHSRQEIFGTLGHFQLIVLQSVLSVIKQTDKRLARSLESRIVFLNQVNRETHISDKFTEVKAVRRVAEYYRKHCGLTVFEMVR